MAAKNTIVYDNEILEVRNKPKKSIGHFQAIGRLGGMNDIFKKLRLVSKPAFELFDDLKDTRDYKNNICFLDIADLSTSKLKMHRSRIKELKDAGIIRKAKTVDKRSPVKKGSFMINPALIKCTYDIDGTQAMWELLK